MSQKPLHHIVNTEILLLSNFGRTMLSFDTVIFVFHQYEGSSSEKSVIFWAEMIDTPKLLIEKLLSYEHKEHLPLDFLEKFWVS